MLSCRSRFAPAAALTLSQLAVQVFRPRRERRLRHAEAIRFTDLEKLAYVF